MYLILRIKTTKFSALRANCLQTSTFDQFFLPKNREEIRIFPLTKGGGIRDFGLNIYPCSELGYHPSNIHPSVSANYCGFFNPGGYDFISGGAGRKQGFF